MELNELDNEDWKIKYCVLKLDYEDLCKDRNRLRELGLKDRQKLNTIESGLAANSIEMKQNG